MSDCYITVICEFQYGYCLAGDSPSNRPFLAKNARFADSLPAGRGPGLPGGQKAATARSGRFGPGGQEGAAGGRGEKRDHVAGAAGARELRRRPAHSRQAEVGRCLGRVNFDDPSKPDLEFELEANNFMKETDAPYFEGAPGGLGGRRPGSRPGLLGELA
eukprot:scaffold1610_cov257-Pinguiococcus_pyrenoidosus.AAC.18